jgi:hypothetical protein
VFRVELRLHQFDTEVPLDLKHELKDIDGINFEVATKQWLIVAEILGSHVGDPQTLQYDRLELLFNAGHDVSMQSKKKEHTTKVSAGSSIRRADYSSPPSTAIT